MSAHVFSPLAKEPAYRQIAKRVEADIVSGRIKPGEALPTEEALSKMFGLSRNTVREGLRVLELSGLVERGAAKRLVVRAPDAINLARNATRALLHSGVSFAQVFEALAVIEPEAAKIAATKASPQMIGRLMDVTEALVAAHEDDHAAIVRAAEQFFEALGEAMDNPVLAVVELSITGLIGASLERVIFATPQARERIVQAQREITEAIAAGDGDRAHQWMARHIEDLKRGYEVAGVDMGSRVG